MNEEAKKESCCHDSGHRCCGVSKCLIKILLGLVLFGAGFYVGKSGLCPWMMCPISQQK